VSTEGADDTLLASDSASSSTSASSVKVRAVHVGDTLGRYELGEEVGEGGMATVYRARDRELRREVAVKVLFPHLARRPEIVHRFAREARAAAALDHPNILRVYDVGSGADVPAASDVAVDPPFIVMELVRGRSLAAELEQRGAMLSELVACIGALLADALAAAHKASVVHRDVKPANVMIDGAGRLLLADFGVARLETEDSLVTRTGALLGTPAYMSPEQATGDDVTARSDLYSLGATLYQLATGHVPYSGPAAKVLSSILSGALVPPVKRRAAVGPELSAVIVKMMGVAPEERHASASEVASELRAIASAGGLADPAADLAAYFSDDKAFVAARMPAIVRGVVAAARAAIGEGRLPRAIALADRALALAPDDPEVQAIARAVTEGDRANRRRRTLALVGLAIVAVGGGALAVRGLAGRPSAGADAARMATIVPDASIDAARQVDADVAAVAVVATLDATAGKGDARASIAPTSRDAHGDDAPTIAIVGADAAVVESLPPDAAEPARPGAIVVISDAWCDISIDGASHGQQRGTPIAVPAGPHDVRCAQSTTGLGWERHVVVAPGQTATASGNLLGDARVTFEAGATIDGVVHERGSTATLRFGRHEVEIAGVREFVTIRGDCTLRPDRHCDP